MTGFHAKLVTASYSNLRPAEINSPSFAYHASCLYNQISQLRCFRISWGHLPRLFLVDVILGSLRASKMVFSFFVVVAYLGFFNIGREGW